jgi:hypothetical protein
MLREAPETAKVANEIGFLPLHCACVSKPFEPEDQDIKPEVVTLLLEKYPFAAAVTDRKGRLSLHLACSRCSNMAVHYIGDMGDVLSAVMDKHPEAAEESDEYGKTPMAYVCESDGPLELIYFLILKNPVGAVTWLSNLHWSALCHRRCPSKKAHLW